MAKRISESTTKPVFPYCTRPSSLRKFLEQVPRRPKPPKVNEATLSSWGITGGDSITVIRVMKALDLLDSNNEPTEVYTQFMHAQNGPGVLALRIREVYGKLFEHSIEPFRETDESLRNLFNIHSGGAEKTIQYQILTFKSLCDYADFTISHHRAQPLSSPKTLAQPLSKQQTCIKVTLLARP